MATVTTVTIQELLKAKDRELEPSAWRTVEQPQVDAFADTTDDHQWIHVDVARAAGSVWGGTIAHGYLVLSLVPSMLQEVFSIGDEGMGVNYGIEKLRFTAPVPVGSRIRLRATLKEAHERSGGGAQYVIGAVVETEGSDRPALVADVVYLALP
jgi:acyl dehydratase